MKAVLHQSEAFEDFSCFAYTLQLAINNATGEVEGIKYILAKCRKIVSHYHHSCQASKRLHKEQNRLGHTERALLMAVATCWNSDFFDG